MPKFTFWHKTVRAYYSFVRNTADFFTKILPHMVLSIQKFSQTKYSSGTIAILQPLSLHLITSCSQLEVILKGHWFELVKEIQKKTLQQLNVNIFTFTHRIPGKMEISLESVYLCSRRIRSDKTDLVHTVLFNQSTNFLNRPHISTPLNHSFSLVNGQCDNSALQWLQRRKNFRKTVTWQLLTSYKGQRPCYDWLLHFSSQAKLRNTELRPVCYTNINRKQESEVIHKITVFILTSETIWPERKDHRRHSTVHYPGLYLYSMHTIVIAINMYIYNESCPHNLFFVY